MVEEIERVIVGMKALLLAAGVIGFLGFLVWIGFTYPVVGVTFLVLFVAWCIGTMLLD